MRKARRKHHHHHHLNSTAFQDMYMREQDIHSSKMVTTSDVLSSKAAPPLTLPALPMRQLPRRNKRPHQPNITLQQQPLPHHYQSLLSGQYFETATTLAQQGTDKSYNTELKLPDIVPGRPSAIVSQRGGALVDSISPVKMNQMLNWRTLHAQGM